MTIKSRISIKGGMPIKGSMSMKGGWYDLTPAEYAIGLRYDAKRNEERAKAAITSQDAEQIKYHNPHRLDAARRLHAMAMICDETHATRAGDVDFLDLDHPEIAVPVRDAIVTAILAKKPAQAKAIAVIYRKNVREKLIKYSQAQRRARLT